MTSQQSKQQQMLQADTDIHMAQVDTLTKQFLHYIGIKKSPAELSAGLFL
jgi:hypothetical protein